MSVKIVPKIKKEEDAVTVSDLNRGDCFLTGKNLYQLYNKDPAAQNMQTGEYQDFDLNCVVVPVDIEIRWTKKAKKKGAKK